MERKMFLRASRLIFENAKVLRNNPTHAETLMWGYLKQRPLGYKFRLQHPISDYIADFYCHELKMIIEIDGSIHAEADVAVRDMERQTYLEQRGMTFLRFANDDVEKRLEEVIIKTEKFITNHSLRVQNIGKPL